MQWHHLSTHFFDKSHNMQKDEPKSTVLIIAMGFLILFFVYRWEWALITSLSVGIAGVLSNTLSKLIEKGWMQFARILSYIMPSLLLGLVFYLILFPISIISKIFTEDPLMLSNKYRTYFVTINKKINKQDFEKMW